MVKLLLVIATLADGALAALLVGVSGFLFGGGPESMRAGTLAAVAYFAAVIACLAAPVAGFIFNKKPVWVWQWPGCRPPPPCRRC